ncbi:glycosyltransferase family 2 protein [Salinimicrobium sp. WS361]|uniref:glycosyltransferase family 2 protein n=1 Tax=Salinimicrobium sp. WS361 TaxID=3425123 RepID=UPI003D6EA89D
MSNDNHLISIILPVYNGEEFLTDAIESILNQSYTNFELIIVDDASTDRSLSIAQEFFHIDERIKIISNSKNLLLPESLNIGHLNSKGDYITWTSDDNKMKVHCLDKLYKTIIDKDCDLVYSYYDIIWADGELKRINHPGPVTGLIFGNTIGASFLYKREIFEELNGYRKDLYLVEDYHFFLAASLKFNFFHLKESLYEYRIHPRSLTTKIDADEVYTFKFNMALRKVYNEVGRNLKFHEVTIEFLLSSYFNKDSSFSIYLNNRDIIEKDLLNFQKKLFLSDVDILVLLRNRIREGWNLNKKELTLRNLFKVLRRDRSLLLSRNYNSNLTLSIMYNCFRKYK